MDIVTEYNYVNNMLNNEDFRERCSDAGIKVEDPEPSLRVN